MSLFVRSVALVGAVLLSWQTAVAQDVAFTVDATHDGQSIPDSVYGVNDIDIAGSTVNRHGGNRHTGLNWENNASNAGSDYLHSSDSFLGANAGIGDSQAPGALLQAWVDADRHSGRGSIITLPLAGYVAADMNGPVSEAESAPSSRWNQLVIDKPAALSLQPDLSDGVVYLDEMVNFLVAKYGETASGGVAAYSMDNEPALWPSTHPRIHPNATRYEELVMRDSNAARMVTRLDPSAQIYGPVLYGWNAHLNLQEAPDASSFNSTYGTFTNYYLAQMKSASDASGRRLLHRFDMHWYPEARGDHRIVFEGSSPSYGTDNDIDARLQAPRSLWDPSYLENSWITQYTTDGKGIRLLPRLQESIDQYFPGTGIALTEYNYGATGHISGGVAQADVLGILGRYRTAACFWPLSSDNSYVQAAFALYRNYDGQGAGFGSISLEASVNDNGKAAVHAARTLDGEITIMAINRSRTDACAGGFEIALPPGHTVTGVHGYRLSSAGGPQPQPIPTPSFSGASFADTLPAMSATLYRVEIVAAVEGQLRNISTRCRVGTGDNVLIGGFIEQGSYTRQLVIRALGPSLVGAGVQDALMDPVFQMHDPDGLASRNDNWMTSQKTALETSGLAPGHELEAAFIGSYGPNRYTIVVEGVGGTAGVGLVEVYAVDDRKDTRLANLSTRGFVGVGDDLMIGGFIVGGGPIDVVMRAIGPSLAHFGVQNPLLDPVIELHDSDGALIASNDNWQEDSAAGVVEQLDLAPPEAHEAALSRRLPAGNYTAIMRGVADGTGIGLVEVYHVR